MSDPASLANAGAAKTGGAALWPVLPSLARREIAATSSSCVLSDQPFHNCETLF